MGKALTSAKRKQVFIGEGLGTAMLLMAIVGSGIMAERLAQGNTALALLANSVATGAALIALILTFGGISGAHFNPIVTVMSAFQGVMRWRDVLLYLVAQIGGAFVGVACVHLMFELPVFTASQRVRGGSAQVFSEAIATFGLLTIIWGCGRRNNSVIPFAVGSYIMSAYWFTSSTSFANPAVTLARSVTDTFTGVRPVDVPGFIVGQLIGGCVATALCRWYAGQATRAD